MRNIIIGFYNERRNNVRHLKNSILFCIIMFVVFLTGFYCDKLAYQVNFSEKAFTMAETSTSQGEKETEDQDDNEDIILNNKESKSNKKTKQYLWVGISIISVLLLIILVGMFLSRKGKMKRKTR